MQPGPHPPSCKSVVYLNTNIGKACEACGFTFNGWYDLGTMIQHYLDHGYKLLHAGQETSYDSDGRPWSSTVAVLQLK